MTEVHVKEVRSTPIAVECRSATRLGGYAAVFNAKSKDLGGFVEQIAPSFFERSRMGEWKGVVCRLDHTDVLGSISEGNLQLTRDGRGLDYTVEVNPNTHSHVLTAAQQGQLQGSSFAFLDIGSDWKYVDGFALRTLVTGVLLDVAPLLGEPAYADSTVALRSLAEQVGAPLEDVQQYAQAGELRKFLTRTDGPAPNQDSIGSDAIEFDRARQAAIESDRARQAAIESDRARRMAELELRKTPGQTPTEDDIAQLAIKIENEQRLAEVQMKRGPLTGAEAMAELADARVKWEMAEQGRSA